MSRTFLQAVAELICRERPGVVADFKDYQLPPQLDPDPAEMPDLFPGAPEPPRLSAVARFHHMVRPFRPNPPTYAEIEAPLLCADWDVPFEGEFTAEEKEQILRDFDRGHSDLVSVVKGSSLDGSLGRATAHWEASKSAATSGTPTGTQHPQPAPAKPYTRKQAKRGKGKLSTAKQMLGMLADDSTRIGWTAQQWADELGVQKSTVIECDAWKSLVNLRKGEKAERAEKYRHADESTRSVSGRKPARRSE
jgi:hypothetical protein